MQIGEAIIAGSIINLIGFIIIMHFRDNAWFKKQTWKMNASNQRAINKLNIKKLEKQLGLTAKSAIADDKAPSILDNLPDLINIAKENPELLEMLGGALDTGESTGILGFINEHPEILQGITKGLSKVTDSEQVPIGER